MPGTQQYATSFARLFGAANLKPRDWEDVDAGRAINTIVNALHGLPMWSVDRIAKGGSFGKATSVRGSFDVDLVVFVNPLGGRDFIPEAERRDMLAAAADALRRRGARVLKVGDRRIKLQYAGVEMDVVLVENR
jgi:hypothetical protein